MRIEEIDALPRRPRSGPCYANDMRNLHNGRKSLLGLVGTLSRQSRGAQRLGEPLL